jgi:hypothetical protein
MAIKNADGLTVRYFTEQSELAPAGYHDIANLRSIVLEIGQDYLYPVATVGGDDTLPTIPAGAMIHSAFLKVHETFTASGAATLTIGTGDKDGAAVDADGIDATIALAALASGMIVKCDGAQVASETATSSFSSKEQWITTTVATGPLTAGRATLTVYFVEDTVFNA